MILVAITTYKRLPNMLESAVKSVITQTYKDWKLVIVDDSPSDWELRDDVKKMVEGYAEKDSRIRYVAHDRNYGAQRARNTALKIANEEDFEFIAYLDDDDEWLPEKLEKQLAKFQECGKDVAMVNCGYFEINEIKNYSITVIPGKTEGVKTFDLAIMCGPTSSPLIRTKCIKVTGGFDEALIAHQEWELFIRLMQLYKVEFVREPLWIYHIHKGERTNSSPGKYIAAKEYIIKKHMQYLENNNDEYWEQLANFFVASSRLSLKTWLKMVHLKPWRIVRNLYTLMKPILLFEKFMQWLAKYPAIYNKLINIKRRLKGENIN